MDLREQFHQHVGKTGVQTPCGLLKCAWQEGRDFFHRDLAGVFTRLGAAHAVAHGKGEVVFFQRGFAKFSQPENFPCVKLEAEKGVLVVLAHPADVGATGPFERKGF